MSSFDYILKTQNRKYYPPLLKRLFAQKGEKRVAPRGLVLYLSYFILSLQFYLRRKSRVFSSFIGNYQAKEKSFLDPVRSFLDPVRNFLDPEWSFLDPVRNFLDPEWSFLDPVRNFLDPEWSFLDPVRSFLDPEWSFLDPEWSFLDPVRSFLDPVRSFLDPERSIRDPEKSLFLPINRLISGVNYDFRRFTLFWNFTKAGPETMNIMVF